MYCVKCGTELLPDAKFCTSCGVAVDFLNTNLNAHVPVRNTRVATLEKVAANSSEIDGVSSNDQETSHRAMRKAGIAAAATLFTVMLAAHNPTGGYETTETYCDHEAIEAHGGRYPIPREPTLDDLMKSCHDISGKSWRVTRNLSIWNYESNEAVFEPLRKISGLLFGSALICILLVVWLRLYGKK